CIREIGPEYWLNIIKILNSINEKRGHTFWGYEYSYFAKIYKELDLFEEHYYAICHLVEADHYISIYDIEYIIKNTYYRTALIETLKANIKDGNDSVANKSFIEALKLLKES
ncbi:TPA: nucleotidyltransferase, partial [Listeria monocytogenes]|nr:nucleotidyltransferase [Listeria monocytogenes]